MQSPCFARNRWRLNGGHVFGLSEEVSLEPTWVKGGHARVFVFVESVLDKSKASPFAQARFEVLSTQELGNDPFADF